MAEDVKEEVKENAIFKLLISIVKRVGKTEVDARKFNYGNASAGIRVRKQMQKIRKDAKLVRNEVQKVREERYKKRIEEEG